MSLAGHSQGGLLTDAGLRGGACMRSGGTMGRAEGLGVGGEYTHPVTPRWPGSAVQTGGLEDGSKWHV